MIKKFYHRWIPVLLLTVFLTVVWVFPTFALDNQELNYIKYSIATRYVEDIPLWKLENKTLEEIFEGLDRHSAYYTPEMMESLMENIQGEFFGIGIYLQNQEGKHVIVDLVEEAPAQAAGLLPKDEIIKIDGESVQSLSLDEVSERIKGPEGSTVNLTVKRGTKELSFPVTRAPILVESLVYGVLEGDIGFIAIESFSGHTSEEVAVAIEKLKEQGVRKLVIDLRDNPGGSLHEVVEVAKQLIPRGPIVHLQYKKERITYTSNLEEMPFEKIGVLVNENSASAAEILAVAIQDRGIGQIIGKTTYGKGSVQRLYPLPSGAGFKLTEAIYLSPKGKKIDGVGVTPDKEVKRFKEEIDLAKLDQLSKEEQVEYIEKILSPDEDLQLQEALAYLKGKDFKIPVEKKINQ